MRHGVNIVALADRIIADAVASTKTAAVSDAPQAEPVLLHPVVVMLKQAAAAIRASGGNVSMAERADVSLASVEKLASRVPGVGGGGVGAGAGISLPSVSSPALKTTNLGLKAGTGGASATSAATTSAATKAASELRKIAHTIRQQDSLVSDSDEPNEKTAHVLNAARGLHRLLEGLS